MNSFAVKVNFQSCHECIRPLDKSVLLKMIFLLFNQNICCGTQKNKVNESAFLSIQNKC